MSLSKKAIEDAACNAVTNQIQQSPILATFISGNDKTPSFDGHICIYQDKKHSKRGMKCVNVQVKGQEHKQMGKNKVSFPMDIDDLKNYKENGGCLLFVVYVAQEKKDGKSSIQTKIYYQELTPVKIIQILSSTTAKVKPSVEVKSLPNDTNEIEDILTNFFEQNRLQAGFSRDTLPQLQDLEKKGIIEALRIPFFSRNYHPTSPAGLSGYDVYLYAKIKNSDVLQPLLVLPREIVDKQIINKTVSVAGKVYYPSYTVIHKKGLTIAQIGNSFSIQVIDGEQGCKMNYKSSSMIRSLAKDGEFILAVIENKGFDIDNIHLSYNESSADMSNFDIEKQMHNVHIFKRYVEMLDNFGCDNDLDFGKLSDEDKRNLDRLTASVIDNQWITGLRNDIPMISQMTIGNLKFVFWFDRNPKDSSSYRIKNIMDFEQPMFTVGHNDKERYPVPATMLFSANDYVEICNIQFERILGTFMRFSANPFIYEVSNDVMLRMIAAFDKTKDSIRKQKLYDTAVHFAEWLCSMPQTIWDKRIAKLNLMQLNYRNQGLTKDDENTLYTMIENSKDREDVLFGAYVLLNQPEQAKRHFDKLPEEQKKQMLQYPICHLWKY